jgi:MFS transporter, NRE family, putaive nickel resistance protein
MRTVSFPFTNTLSSATYQLLGVLGPGLAGAVAAFIGARQVFFLDGVTFLIAAILILALPGRLMVEQSQQGIRTVGRTLIVLDLHV